MGNNRQQMAVVYTAEDSMTANLLMGTLAAEGIEAVLFEQKPALSRQAGPRYIGEVSVPLAFAADARATVQEFLVRLAGGDDPPVSEVDLAEAAEASYDPNV